MPELVVRFVAKTPGLTGPMIATRLGLNYGSVSAVLYTLTSQGVITHKRITDPEHFRSGQLGYFTL